jgi:ankyrin repeat protein
MFRASYLLALSLTVVVAAFAGGISAIFAGELHDSVRANDSASLEALLESGTDVDESDYFLGTALHTAVSEGSTDLAKLLIDHNADLEAVSEQQGAKAMHMAAQFGDVPMLQLLLDHGADIDSLDDVGRTPLHQAALFGHAKAVGQLLDHGADIEAKDSRYGQTALMRAASNGKLDVVKLLVEGGSDLEARDAAGRTALREAATPVSWSAVGNASLIEYLAAVGANVNARESNGLTILGGARNYALRFKSHVQVVDVLRRLGATE